MKPETFQHIVGQYQQWLADTQLQLATANATIAELRTAAPNGPTADDTAPSTK